MKVWELHFVPTRRYKNHYLSETGFIDLRNLFHLNYGFYIFSKERPETPHLFGTYPF